MPDYANGKIYMIVNEELDLCYIGSTTQSLKERMKEHRNDARNEKRTVTSKQLFESGNPEIILITDYPCNSKQELEEGERHFIESMDCVNKTIPTRTREEWSLLNKNRIKLKKMEWEERK